jgi:hypothetical protein
MTPAVACPNRDVLNRLLLGRLPLPEGEQLAQDLEGCAHCTSIVQTLQAEDTLVEPARTPAPWGTASKGKQFGGWSSGCIRLGRLSIGHPAARRGHRQAVETATVGRCGPARPLGPGAKVLEYEMPCGVYAAGRGLGRGHLFWGHDEYLYQVVKDYLPEEALYTIRYHSFYAAHREGPTESC